MLNKYFLKAQKDKKEHSYKRNMIFEEQLVVVFKKLVQVILDLRNEKIAPESRKILSMQNSV